MIDLAKILNTDAATTLREALESHVYWQLSDQHYRNNGFVIAPGSDDPDMRRQIIEACEIDAALAAIAPVDEDKLSVLLDEIEAHELGLVPTYQCACSWVGGDPDEGPGRGTSRYRVKGRVGDKIRFTLYRPADPKAPTCPACWAKDKKRVVVLPVEDHARCEVACEECGEPIREDESPGVWLHVSGADADAHHVARPEVK